MSTKTTNDLSAWLEESRRALAAAADQPSIEAVTLLGSALGKTRAWIYAHPETNLSAADQTRLDDWLSRRLSGEPLPYILGKWEFYGLEFEVSPAVLIPRPETELLVDLAREWLRDHSESSQIIDVGTGSGCIACSLAHWMPECHVIASDISRAALEIAGKNIQHLGLERQIHRIQADLMAPFRSRFDLILANLPYIPDETLRDLEVAQHEPNIALAGGPDGLRLIEALLRQASTRLSPGGRILLEIEISQENSAPDLGRNYFPNATIQVRPDLAGLPRVVVIDC